MLLVIYASEYQENIIPFVNWKEQRGLTTITAEYPAETGSDANSIKNYIQNLYDSPEGLTYIILRGIEPGANNLWAVRRSSF